jgi:hypothetical protein
VSRLQDAVRKLRSVTEEQLDAAVHLRSSELASLNQSRVDALFELRIVLAEEGLPSDGDAPVPPPLREEVHRLHLAEQRLSSVAHVVLDRLARIGAASHVPVYGRSGLPI